MIQPFFRPKRNAWYVEVKGKEYPLGKDKEEAFKEFHRLMAGELPVTTKTPAINLIDQFLVWTKENRSEATYDWYYRHLQSFADYIGPKKRVHEIKPGDVDKWLTRKYKTSGANDRNGACRAVARAFNWAVKKQLIQASPVKGMERPAYEPSEACLTAEQWTAMTEHIKPSDALHDAMWFMHETGCRPQEVRILEAKHLDRAKRRFVLNLQDSKGKKFRRVIRLNERAFEIVKRLALKHPDGPLFRTRTGKAWTRYTLRSRFYDLGEKIGARLFPYILRHTWATEALVRGVDPLTVAIFLGHKDANMIMRVYSHLVQRDDFLAEQLKRATGEDSIEDLGVA